jgi:hypothetical protein
MHILGEGSVGKSKVIQTMTGNFSVRGILAHNSTKREIPIRGDTEKAVGELVHGALSHRR